MYVTTYFNGFSDGLILLIVVGFLFYTWADGEGNTSRVYEVLMRMKYKSGKWAQFGFEKGPKGFEQEEIGWRILRTFRSVGFLPKSHGNSSWSSDFHWWWAFEVQDLELYQEKIRELRFECDLDRWLDIDFSVGASMPNPPFYISFDESRKPADGKTVILGEDQLAVTITPVGGVGNSDPVSFAVLSGDVRITDESGHTVELTPDSDLFFLYHDAGLEFSMSNHGSPESKILIGSGRRDRGYLLVLR